MILHEVYFNCLGAPDRPGAALAQAIGRDFGSDAFMATINRKFADGLYTRASA